MTTPATAQGVEEFLAHFGAKGMRWGVLDASSRAEEIGSAPFIKLAGSAPGQGAVQGRQAQEAQAAAQESKVADQESAAAIQDLKNIQAEQTQAAVQAHVAAVTAAAAQVAAPSAATAAKASETAADAASEKAHLAEVTAANKAAAKAEAEQKATQAKLDKLEAKDKAAAAKVKVAKAKAAAKKEHAAKLKALAKKTKEAHAKHKASKAKPLTAAQKKAKAAYEKAHPEKHKPLTTAQKAEAAKKAKEKAAANKAAKAKTAVTKEAKAEATKLAAAKPVVSKSEQIARDKLATNAKNMSHGIDGTANLLPNAQPVKQGGPQLVATSPPASTKAPSAAARRMFAKMGLAMPDGSYYVRNGAVGASDLQNAIDAVGRGENAGDSGAAIRKHIMKRAAALKLSSKIPDSWNSDGTLKQSDIGDEVEAFLAHFGVKGMHWGVRKSRTAEELNAKAAEHEKTSVAHAHAALQYQKDYADLQNRGTSSAPFKRVYGDHASAMTNGEFFRNNGQSKAQALQQMDDNLRFLSNLHTKRANSHSAKALQLRQKAAEATHIDEVEEFLAHFGVKGMHWGVRKPRGPASDDSVEAANILAKAKAGRGTHTLSNEELKKVNQRLELETAHKRLTNPSKDPSTSKAVQDILLKSANQEAKKYAAEYAAKGAVFLAAEATKALLGTKTGAGKHS